MLKKVISIGSYSPEVHDFGILITCTKVFRPIICKKFRPRHSVGDPLPNLDFVPKQLQAHKEV